MLFNLIKILMFILLLNPFKAMAVESGMDIGAVEDDQPSLLVFVSFSMPSQSLMQLSQQVKESGGVMVFRGMHKNSMKETLKQMMHLHREGVPAIINPLFFTKYSIEVVPTFVIRQKGNICDQEKSCSPIFDKLTGNVPLSYSLQQFIESGHTKKIARQYLNVLEGRDD